MTKRQWIIIGSIIFILFTSYGLMKFLIAQKPELAKRPPRVTERWVKAEPVSYTAILSPVEANGRVVSTAEVDLIAEASGRIETGDVPLKTGQVFKKGDILFTVYKDEAELALKAQKSQFMNSVANALPDIHIDYADAESDFRVFFNKINIDQPLPPLPKVKSEPLKIFLASRNILADYYAVLQAELKLKRHSVLAPFDGVLSAVNLEVGAYTNTGGRVGTMLATSSLEVDVSVENGNAKWIKTGDPVLLKSTNRNQSWQGTVVRVAEFVDPATQSRSVFVRVPENKNQRLFAGEYLSATFKGAHVQNVMEVPRNALFNHNEVFTIHDGLLKITEVEVVKLTQTQALVRGLEENRYLVVQPLINVAENTAVKILGVDPSLEQKKPPAQADAENKSKKNS